MFENFRKSMRARIAPTGDHISELRQDLNARLQDFRAQRTPAEQARLEQDFAQVLHAWGIENREHQPSRTQEGGRWFLCDRQVLEARQEATAFLQVDKGKSPTPAGKAPAFPFV